MNQFLYWLRQPFPFETGWKVPLRYALIGAGFVFGFLFFLQPFGVRVESGQEWSYLLSCLHFTTITFVIAFLCQAALRAFPAVVQEETWTVGREILFTFFFVTCIAIGNMVYSADVYQYALTGSVFLTWLWMTWAVALFPVAFGVFTKHGAWKRQFEGEAAGLSAQIHQKELNKKEQPQAEQKNTPPKSLLLEGENLNESLTLAADALLYIAAADNYVQVYFLKDGNMVSEMLRSSLKKIENALSDVPQMFRCHRTYLVNMDKVVDISGNAQGYKLHFEEIKQLIPVSRSLNETIKNRLK